MTSTKKISLSSSTQLFARTHAHTHTKTRTKVPLGRCRRHHMIRRALYIPVPRTASSAEQTVGHCSGRKRKSLLLSSIISHSTPPAYNNLLIKYKYNRKTNQPHPDIFTKRKATLACAEWRTVPEPELRMLVGTGSKLVCCRYHFLS